ncbi:hypothetical protein FRC07_008464, partial [Ceratobasidium sp. 392]
EVITGRIPYSELSNRAFMLAASRQELVLQRPTSIIPRESHMGNNLWRVIESCSATNPRIRPKVSLVRDIMMEITDEGLKRRDSLELTAEIELASQEYW